MNSILKTGLIILGLVVLVYVINMYMGKREGMKHGKHEKEEEEAEKKAPEGGEGFVEASEKLGSNSSYQNLGGEPLGKELPNDCFPKDQLAPGELLPGNDDSQWAKVNPTGQGELGEQNFLSAGFHIGVNTVGQSLRNANLQIRSEPANPQVKVSPWQQTTIEPDTNRRPLEIANE